MEPSINDPILMALYFVGFAIWMLAGRVWWQRGKTGITIYFVNLCAGVTVIATTFMVLKWLALSISLQLIVIVNWCWMFWALLLVILGHQKRK